MPGLPLTFRPAAPTGPAAKTDTRGFVKSPITDMLTAIHGTTTVNVHPTKGISVSHVPGLSTLPAAKGAKAPVKPLPTTPGAVAPVKPLANATKAGPGPLAITHSIHKADGTILDQGVNPNNKPGAKPASATASTAPAAPAVTDTKTASDAINAILAPVIKEIQDSETARAAAGQQAIGGYTSNAQHQLAGLDPQAPFTQAAGGENAINTALLARLTGQGSDLQNDVQGKISAIDPTLAAKIGAATGATASSAANAGLANGDATASELLSEGANAGAYGKKLPGITALAGAQDTGKLQGQVASDQKTQLADLQSKVPGMVQSELATLSSARTAAEKNRIAVALAENIDPATGQLNAKGRAELAKIAIEQQNANTSSTRASISQQNADTAATRAANSQANADRNAGFRKESLGIQEKKLQAAITKSQQDAKLKGKLHGLTENEYQTKAAAAAGLARIAHAPTPDGHPPVSWQQFLNGGLKSKVPIWILIEEGRKVYSQDEIKRGLIPKAK